MEVVLGVAAEDLEDYRDGDRFGGNPLDDRRDFIVKERARTSGFADACDLEMDGFYLQAAYTLAGEARGYQAEAGAFGAVRPKNKGGAWELVARYEEAGIDVPGRSLGADLERLVLGVNWYANGNVRFMLNYVDAEVRCSTTTRHYLRADGSASDTTRTLALGCNNGENGKADGEAISLRGQYAFRVGGFWFARADLRGRDARQAPPPARRRGA